MAAPTAQTPTNQLESKSALKKKKAKAVAEASNAPAASGSEVAPSQVASDSNNGDAYESPYIKELYKWV